jgi:5'-phosphate synthase pdxT subunit
VEGSKKGGQDLLGGISVSIARNGWGSQVSPLSMKCAPSYLVLCQVESFEADLIVSGLDDSYEPFKGIFIRAPVSLPMFTL